MTKHNQYRVVFTIKTCLDLYSLLWPLFVTTAVIFLVTNAKNINLSYFMVNILELEREKNYCMDCYGWKIGLNKIGHKTVIVVIDAPKQIILAPMVKVYHLVIFFKILSINVGFSYTDLLVWTMPTLTASCDRCGHFFFMRSTLKDVIYPHLKSQEISSLYLSHN